MKNNNNAVMDKETWQPKLWELINNWIESDDRKKEVLNNNYAKIEEFVESLIKKEP